VVSSIGDGTIATLIESDEWRWDYGDYEPSTSRPLPPYPTYALPGSDEKVRVMRERWEDGYHIHHPRDARLTDDPLSESRMMQAVRMVQLIAEMLGR
jgi:hypothetical protein